MSEESRARMREAQRITPRTERQKAAAASNLIKLNASLRGVPKTVEHKQKISQAKMGRPLSEETRMKMRGRQISEATREKFRQRKFSVEARKKMSDAHKGITGALHPSSKPIAQYSLGGDKLRTFAGTAEAVRETGIPRTSIKNCLNGYSKTAKGFRWAYVQS